MIEAFNIRDAVEAIFQLVVFFTGVLFSIHCFVIVSSNPFIERLFSTTDKSSGPANLTVTLLIFPLIISSIASLLMSGT